MARIFIESHPVFINADPIDHLYLVFQSDAGTEKVISARPFIAPAIGKITVEVAVPITSSADARGNETPQQRGQREISLDGRNANHVWDIMKQHAQNIKNAAIEYILMSQNSNSVVASVLNAVGIDVLNCIPTNTKPVDL